MKKLIITAACLVGMGLVQVANALNITPATMPQWTGTDTSQAAINTAIAPIIGSAVELYKSDVGTGESGALAGSYETTFSNTPSDPEDATTVYGTGDIVGAPAFALVKDGNSTPAWYLFNLTALGWDGMDTLYFTDFWPGKGAISHVALYGTQTSVPDGGMTAVLLGLGMVGLGVMARRKA